MANATACYHRISTPLGPLWAAATDAGVCAIELHRTEEDLRRSLTARALRPEHTPERLQALERELTEYLTGERPSLDAPPDLSGIGGFRRDILLTLYKTRFGEVVSYGELAYRAGHPRAARAAGNAVATNPVPLIIPCHRVIRSDGTPGSYAVRSLPPAEGLKLKLHLLALEGVRL
ncbi:methylated-DNA--[protein]-cysteine S-methyltransferase [Rubrobacter taiwanensis]|jgi:methylated-DNA-[protein]-cysteine S-methyltransferase|nr:methylated-DNA--[protein]-cysteine S-methyltransferase [Rubrobacter taiwanensis]